MGSNARASRLTSRRRTNCGGDELCGNGARVGVGWGGGVGVVVLLFIWLVLVAFELYHGGLKAGTCVVVF